MKFRTEIGPIAHSFEISHDDRIVLLGSCFADNIGEMLERDGFRVVHNPLGPLFNPLSIEAVLVRGGEPFVTNDFVEIEGVWHCLWFANRFQAVDPLELARMVNGLYLPLHKALQDATVIILTFGTTRVFCYGAEAKVAGNCHKINPSSFEERDVAVEEIASLPLAEHYPAARRIVTVSPVKYPGQGLSKSFLSKATLRLAADILATKRGYDYFPSYEIVSEDLRDYRFYAADLRHPSEVAAQYIYEHFSTTYFTASTRALAEERRRQARRAAHIPMGIS